MAKESTLYNNFAAPEEIFIAGKCLQTNGALEEFCPSIVWGKDISTRFYFGWRSSDKTYQIRWRYRTRDMPTAANKGGWCGWSAWAGANTCGRKTSRETHVTPSNTQNPNTWFMANARPKASTNEYAANQSRYMHYLPRTLDDLYPHCDAEQYQVQVRTWGEGNQMHGHHREQTFTIYYAPRTFTVDSVKLNDSDGLRVYYSTDWNRDGNAVEITWQDGSVSRIENVKGGLNGTYFTIPSSKLDQDYDVYVSAHEDHTGEVFHPKRVRFITADTPDAFKDDTTVNLRVQALYASALPNPAISVRTDEEAHLATVTLRQSGSSYSWKTVTVWAGWYAPDGKWTTCFPSRVVSETNYDVAGNYTREGVYEFNNVPSDIAVSYRAKVLTSADDNDSDGGTTVRTARATSDAWGTDAYGRSGTIMASKGRAFLSIGDATAALVCALDEAGVTWSRSYAPNVETETCAGRQREVSRHGVGGSASVQVRGDIVYDTTAHDMGAGRRLADWEAMKRRTGADGFIALPQGIWAKVAVAGIDIDTARPAHSVSLSLEEVS